jgi:hypothetical protein
VARNIPTDGRETDAVLMCGKTDGVRGRLASRSISIDPRDTRLDVAWMHGVCRKTSVDALNTRARGPKTRVVGRYMETDRRKTDAGRRTMDTDFPKTWASVSVTATQPPTRRQLPMGRHPR